MNSTKIIQSLIVGIIPIVMTACEKIDIPKEELTSTFNQVYMPAAVRYPNEVVIKMADSVYQITYGANFGGFGIPQQDIKVLFETDPASAEAFNAKNGTNYALLPGGSYELTATMGVIKKGTLSTEPFAIKINPFQKLELFKDYILAVSVKGTGGEVKLNESLATAYYIITPSLLFSDFPDFDRSEWQVVDVSTEEPAEGETNGGLGIHLIDNKTSTFWHSKWDGGEAPMPHWFTIDMGSSHEVHGLAFTGRQSSNQGKPATVKVEVSANGTDWIEAGDLSPQNINSQQKFFLPQFHTCRYIRITILSAFGSTRYSHLAEFGAF
jgi:hypothetical protein